MDSQVRLVIEFLIGIIIPTIVSIGITAGVYKSYPTFNLMGLKIAYILVILYMGRLCGCLFNNKWFLDNLTRTLGRGINIFHVINCIGVGIMGVLVYDLFRPAIPKYDNKKKKNSQFPDSPIFVSFLMFSLTLLILTITLIIRFSQSRSEKFLDFLKQCNQVTYSNGIGVIYVPNYIR